MKYSPYSHSRIEKASCPFSFKNKYVDRVKGRDHESSQFGKSFHDIVADVIRAQVSEKSYELFGQEGLIRRHMPLSIGHMMQSMVEIFETFRKRFYINRETIVGVEESLAIDEFGNEARWDDAWLRGIVDVIEIDGDTLTITDHKTQWNILNDEDMRKNEQLTMYCYLAHKHYPQLTKFRVQIYFARYGTYRRSERTMEDLEKFEAITRERISQVEAIEEFVPIPGRWCMYCECMNDCPLAKYEPKSTTIPEVITADQVVEMARLLNVREEQIKRLRAALQMYCSEHGSIEYSDKQRYGYVPTESETWNPAELKKVLDEHGQDITEHVNISVRSVRKLINQAQRLHPDLADAVEGIAKTVKKTTFKRH